MNGFDLPSAAELELAQQEHEFLYPPDLSGSTSFIELERGLYGFGGAPLADYLDEPERKLGELTKKMPKGKPYPGSKKPISGPDIGSTKRELLRSAGIPQSQASNYEALADVPEGEFEEAVTPLERAVDAAELECILATLTELGGSRKKTAQTLGIHRTTLFNKMRKYGLLDEPTPPLKPRWRFDGTLLRDARRTQGMRLTDAALAAGVSALDLFKRETGADVPAVSDFEKLRAALGIDTNDAEALRVATGWRRTEPIN